MLSYEAVFYRQLRTSITKIITTNRKRGDFIRKRKKGERMKRYIVAAVVVFMLLILGCDSNAEEWIDPNALCVVSNISENGNVQSRGVDYSGKHPVQGVLLRYHSDGLIDAENSVFEDVYNETTAEFQQYNAFYIEYLEDMKYTSYGTPYNYVIYVPDSIKEAYKDAGGTNPDYGNSFWWYIFQYYGSINANRGDWDKIIDYLLSHRYNLSNANRNEVSSGWLEEVIDAATTAKDPEGKTLKQNICFGHWYNDEPNGESSVKAERIMYFEDGKRNGSGSTSTTLYKIFIPIELDKAYAAGSGRTRRDEALIWYFVTYYNVSIEDFRQAFEQGKIGDLIESCYTRYGYKEPSPYEVKVKTAETVVDFELENVEDSEMLIFGDFFYYLPESLKLEDGTIIEDSSRIYFKLNSGEKLYIYYPIDYILDMKAEIENRGGKYTFNGAEFWNFFKWFCNPSESDIDQENFKISAGMFKKMLEYRTYDGIKDSY